MLDLFVCRTKLPLLVFRLAVPLPPDDHRQHPLVNINAGYTAIYWFHPSLLVIARRRTGIDSQSPSLAVPVRSPGLPLVFPAHGPRSNTLTASPYPVRATTSAAASIYSIFIQDFARCRAWKHPCVHLLAVEASGPMSGDAARRSARATYFRRLSVATHPTWRSLSSR